MKILAINPGSTSTKIAVYEDEEVLFSSTIRHDVKELSEYKNINEQFEFRRNLVLQELTDKGILFRFDAVIGRGGLVKPIPGGVYEVNDALRHDLLHAARQHASNLGGLLAADLAAQVPGCRAFIADPVVVDELEDIARISGSPFLPRISIFHALNQKAIARRYAKEHGCRYEDLNLIVCHLGGGVSVGAHKAGRVVDVNNALDGEGPISPERAGTLPAAQLVELCFSGDFTKGQLLKMITGLGGIAAHLGTTDIISIVGDARKGIQPQKNVFDAMIYTVAKSIGSAATVLKGQIDAVLLTGGMAHSEYIVAQLKEYVSFLAPVEVYPGEDEMGALASNALGALSGELEVKEYRG
ncbi:butyrate kinase [Bacteroides sp. OttesenSCG-928-J23]|nr:butyrate kinase [Bacteroides sp. OttesenSCG-928-N06]MDL2247501.1 butyrate kinase [Bacteroides sp. OttesenSCG-928-J23]MDL2304509.1 butyrate kinase [Bacteroides sp. OttesenSCG-928-D19]